MRSKHRPPPSVDDDVRSSLAVLDRVIGEFDDGLLSSTESEFNSRRPSRHDLRSSAEPEEKEEKIRPDIRGSRLSINEQIDDIFSELTEEIYNEDKLEKSEKRRIFDPLPSPPNTRTHPPPIDRKKKPGPKLENAAKKSQTMDNDRPKSGLVSAAKKSFFDRSEEVVLYNSQDRGSGRRERVTADIHNSSRDSVSPAPPKPEKYKIHLKNSSAERLGRGEAGSRNGSRDGTGSSNGLGDRSGSRNGPRDGTGSRNSPKDGSDSRNGPRDRSGSRNGPGDRSKGRDRESSQGWIKDNSRSRDKSHTRDAEKNLSSREAAMIEELKEKVSDKQGKISKFAAGKGRTGADQSGSFSGHSSGSRRDETRSIPLPPPPPSLPKPSSQHPSSKTSSRDRDFVTDGPKEDQRTAREDERMTRSRKETRGGRPEQSRRQVPPSREGRLDTDYKRSKSVGPLQTRHGSPDTRESRRSRSRGRRGEDLTPDRRRSRSRGRSADPRSRYPGDGSSRRSRSRGPSPSRPSEVDRSGQRSREGERRGWKEFGPPSPEEAQATLEKMLPRFPPGTPAVRQRSMVDLRLSEEFKRRTRRSGAPGLVEEFPVHLRNQGPVPRNLGIRTDIPAFLDEHLRLQHHHNIDIQRELLLRRGFPPSHPLVAGEIPIHPELLGHLHFDLPSRTTLPLGPEDFRRFLPEMQRAGMQSAFPLSTSDLIALQQEADRGNKVKRQKSHKDTSFSSLQYEDMKKKKFESRSQSTEAREKKFRPFSVFQSSGSGWFNPGYVIREAGTEVKTRNEKQWFMKEKHDVQSLPHLETAREGGLGADEVGSQNHLNRGDKNRSSFGMILKDKFQKNPNMYFPDTRPNSRSPEYKNRKPGKEDDLSDTDTLIHNMSEGSFDKDSSLSGGRSVGSSKSNRSSCKSSLSHDSINGTPEMKRRSESITTPKTLNNTAIHLASNPSVILNKKTIRNYTPAESSNMLRQFEEGRHSSMEKKNKSRKSNLDELDIQRRSSMDKLIDDFHRSLPPLPKESSESSSPFSDVDSMFSSSHLDTFLPNLPEHNSIHRSSKTGTVTSQTSNWSVASSAASFDYHMVAEKKSAKLSAKSKDASTKRRMSQSTTNLPALCEVEYTSREDLSPPEERSPPEGAAADSPKQFVQRIEVKGEVERRSASVDTQPKPQRKTGKEAAKDEVKDLLEPSKDGDDELIMLKKLISEGRISGLNEKPPSFKPPTPPSKTASAAKKAKAPVPKSAAPKTPDVSKNPSGDRPRKAREAPAPPEKLKPPPGPSDVKFISGRKIHSVEDLHAEEGRDWRGDRAGRRDQKSEPVQRSTSMHMPRESRGDETDAVAKLIADSTERKFKINNIFKGMWKKKHYSFDLS